MLIMYQALLVKDAYIFLHFKEDFKKKNARYSHLIRFVLIKYIGVYNSKQLLIKLSDT